MELFNKFIPGYFNPNEPIFIQGKYGLVGRIKIHITGDQVTRNALIYIREILNTLADKGHAVWRYNLSVRVDDTYIALNIL
ncbi:hypothetical protein ACONUD_17435 [Microbulbifer harenosus]|uniref:hypothetical protein n=1 Tax=Microbulbifer harenosus TaxID=2576840 RepID=UPI00269B8323